MMSRFVRALACVGAMLSIMIPDDAAECEPTPDSDLVDREGRPYFLWDVDMTLEQFLQGLSDPDPEVRAYLAGKLMRQSRVADVGRFISVDDARAMWPRISRYLGRTREAWRARLDIREP